MTGLEAEQRVMSSLAHYLNRANDPEALEAWNTVLLGDASDEDAVALWMAANRQVNLFFEYDPARAMLEALRAGVSDVGEMLGYLFFDALDLVAQGVETAEPVLLYGLTPVDVARLAAAKLAS